MSNILEYFNLILELIFGSSHGEPTLQLVPPSSVHYYLSRVFSNSSDGGLLSFIENFFQLPDWMSILFSVFVWTWFAILVFKLLLVYPFNWLRSIIRKCRG